PALAGDEGEGGRKQAAPRRLRQGSGGRARRGASPPCAPATRPVPAVESLGLLLTPRVACKASGASLGFGGYKGGTRCSVEGVGYWLLHSKKSEELKFDPCWIRVLDSENRRVSSCSS